MMTEYDALSIYREQQEKDHVSAIESSDGVLKIYFKDGTIEHWKKSIRRNKFKKIRSRNED